MYIAVLFACCRLFQDKGHNIGSNLMGVAEGDINIYCSFAQTLMTLTVALGCWHNTKAH